MADFSKQQQELMDYYAIGQCTPGIIAVNVATFTGYSVKGFWGAVGATLGVITPSVIIVGLIAMFISGGSAKRTVISLSVINQLLFMFLYIIPLTDWDRGVRQGIFIATIVLAYFFYNVAHPKKINWFMSLVDDGKRGRFTAKK